VVLNVLAWIVQAYILVLFVRIVLSWFPSNPWSALGKVTRALARVTDPVLVPLRRRLPPLRVGGSAIDLSPLVLFVVLEILLRVL